MVIFLVIFCVILIIALVSSIVVNVRYGNMLMNLEDNIETCLDILDKRYRNLMHVFDDSPGLISNDPLVKSFIKEVQGARNDVLIIANIISKPTELVGAIGDADESEALNNDSGDATQPGENENKI